jgi:hypothetical protein
MRRREFITLLSGAIVRRHRRLHCESGGRGRPSQAAGAARTSPTTIEDRLVGLSRCATYAAPARCHADSFACNNRRRRRAQSQHRGFRATLRLMLFRCTKPTVFARIGGGVWVLAAGDLFSAGPEPRELTTVKQFAEGVDPESMTALASAPAPGPNYGWGYPGKTGGGFMWTGKP